MSHRYLNKFHWSEITRDERFFCSELYRVIYGSELGFVHWLEKKLSLGLNTSCGWEMATEVCFYRDFEMSFPGSVPSDMYSQKRTFDICLFGPDQVVIIEAKSHQEMPLAEAIAAERDADNVQHILGLHSRPATIALVSNEYKENHSRHSRAKPLCRFDGTITWGELAEEYDSYLFQRANSIYKDRRKSSKKDMQRTRYNAGR